MCVCWPLVINTVQYVEVPKIWLSQGNSPLCPRLNPALHETITTIPPPHHHPVFILPRHFLPSTAVTLPIHHNAIALSFLYRNTTLPILLHTITLPLPYHTITRLCLHHVIPPPHSSTTTLSCHPSTKPPLCHSLFTLSHVNSPYQSYSSDATQPQALDKIDTTVIEKGEQLLNDYFYHYYDDYHH